MLRANVVIVQAARLVHRQFDNLLRSRRQSRITDDQAIAPANNELDRRAHLRQLHAEVGEHPGGDAVALTHEAEEQSAPCRCSCG